MFGNSDDIDTKVGNGGNDGGGDEDGDGDGDRGSDRCSDEGGDGAGNGDVVEIKVATKTSMKYGGDNRDVAETERQKAAKNSVRQD